MGEAALLGRSRRKPAERLLKDATATSSSSSGTRTMEDYKAAFGGIKDAWTTILALAAVAGTLVVVGKIGADIAQRQARG